MSRKLTGEAWISLINGLYEGEAAYDFVPFFAQPPSYFYLFSKIKKTINISSAQMMI